MAAQLEELGRAGTLDEASSLVERLAAAFERVRPVLETIGAGELANTP